MGQQSDGVRVIAHRGFAGRYPENTVAAVEAAARGGRDGNSESHPPVSMVEVDAVPTADGTPVVFHDDELSGRDDGGLTDTSGVVWETDTETVTSATVLGTKETVPTLAEVLAAVPDGVRVNVELKNPGSDEVVFGPARSEAERSEQREIWRPFTERVLAVVDDHSTDVLVSSFAEAAIAAVRQVAPEIPVAFLFAGDAEEGLEITRAYDCEAMHVPTELVSGTPFADGSVDVDLVELAHEEGRECNVWTVGTWYQARQLADAGVDGIIVDYPGLLGFES